jgi:hypothetical protein
MGARRGTGRLYFLKNPLVWVVAHAAWALCALVPSSHAHAQALDGGPSSNQSGNLRLTAVKSKVVVLGRASSVRATKPPATAEGANSKTAGSGGIARSPGIAKTGPGAAPQPNMHSTIPTLFTINVAILILDLLVIVAILASLVRRWLAVWVLRKRTESAKASAPGIGEQYAHFASTMAPKRSGPRGSTLVPATRRETRPRGDAAPACDVEMLRVLFEQNVQLREQIGSLERQPA